MQIYGTFQGPACQLPGRVVFLYFFTPNQLIEPTPTKARRRHSVVFYANGS